MAALSGRLRLYLMHLASPGLRRRVDLRDLEQDTHLRALRSHQALNLEGEDLWRYVRKIARGAVVDAARQARRLPRRASSLAPTTESGSGPVTARPANQPGPPTQALAAENEQRLHAAFEALPPDFRRVIGLRRLEGLSAAATAVRMGRSETAIHSLFRRALGAWASAAEVDTKR